MVIATGRHKTKPEIFFFFLIQKDRQHYIGRLNENGMWGKCDERAAAHNLLPGADPFKEL